jgi:superfamily I DNA/RNA helicase
VQNHLADNQVVTWAQLYARLGDWVAEKEGRFPYAHVVVDEAQDLAVAQARFLAGIGRQGKEALFFTGDQGQRIFHLPFSWSSLGIDIRGRSQSLKVNYRTSHQIRSAADRLLPTSLTDADGIEEGRKGTVSVFNGPEPLIVLVRDEAEEAARVAEYLASCLADGMEQSDLAILIRSQHQLPRTKAVTDMAQVDGISLQGIKIATMHDAKGLEFRAVAVMACDDAKKPVFRQPGRAGLSPGTDATHDIECDPHPHEAELYQPNPLSALRR